MPLLTGTNLAKVCIANTRHQTEVTETFLAEKARTFKKVLSANFFLHSIFSFAYY
jgi:hypothetical protein